MGENLEGSYKKIRTCLMILPHVFYFMLIRFFQIFYSKAVTFIIRKI